MRSRKVSRRNKVTVRLAWAFPRCRTTVAYIKAQAAHHAKRDFQGEFLAFLKKHGIDYDPRYVLG